MGWEATIVDSSNFFFFSLSKHKQIVLSQGTPIFLDSSSQKSSTLLDIVRNSSNSSKTLIISKNSSIFVNEIQ